MKRQRGVNSVKFEGAVMEVAEMGKKKAKIEVDEKEKEEEGKEIGLVGITGDNWTNWEEYWPWVGGVVDEQMSWGSIWFPVWDMDFMGEAFSALYSDVAWDDDIWNLKKEIPNPFEG